MVNGTGRQTASLIRVASAVGFSVRAQVYTRKGIVADELSQLPDVTLLEGPLSGNTALIDNLFKGAKLAFINTCSQAGDEVAMGKALADGAKRAGTIKHYVYSSMPDHSIHNPQWPALPLWACKFTVENYVRQLGLPSTFVYAGIYNNNFTSLPYPLFCMSRQNDGSFEWRAPFDPDVGLPWLDAEHDVGPAILQILKDGPAKWNGHRIALTFEVLSPKEVCRLFARALNRPCHYVCDPKIAIHVAIPAGYRAQLEGIEALFGQMKAPYYPGPEFPRPVGGSTHPISQHLIREARELWQGWRGMEEYAREVFPVEEEANKAEYMT